MINPFLQVAPAARSAWSCSACRPGDPIRKKMYRSFHGQTDRGRRQAGARQLAEKLASFAYKGERLPATLTLSARRRSSTTSASSPGSTPGPFNPGFWELPIPVTRTSTWIARRRDLRRRRLHPLRRFLKQNRIRHVLLTGYATDMCFCRTTAGYENLSKDFNVFLVGDATLATFPSNDTPRFATNAADFLRGATTSSRNF